jgi:hypothetical protein
MFAMHQDEIIVYNPCSVMTSYSKILFFWSQLYLSSATHHGTSRPP